MRGTTPIPVPVPEGGWRTDKPIHQLPLDCLISQPGSLDSQNVIIDFDGLLKPRLGYEVLHDFGERLMGGISWTDVTGTVEIIVATLTRWWAFRPAGWEDITGTPNSANVQAPSRFAVFGVDPVTHTDVLYGVNGSGVDPVHRWVLTNPFQPYTDLDFNGQSFSARDLLVVGNRLVFVGVTIGGVYFPQRVIWSSVLDGTSLPQLAYNDLLDGDAGAVVAIRLTSRTSAVLYTQNGPPYSMTAQPGSDAAAFSFDKIQDGLDGPISAGAIVNVGGARFYIAQDQHVYLCDGHTTRSISPPIDAFLASSSGLAVGPEQKPVVLYDKRRGKVWFFVAFIGDGGEASHAVCFDLRRGGIWEPPQQFADAITAAFPVLDQMGPTWDNPGLDADGNELTWETAPWTSWDNIPANFEPAMYIGTKDGLLCRFFNASTDRGVPISWSATWGVMSPGPMNHLKVGTIDVQLNPQQNSILGAGDLFTLKLLGLSTPYDPAPQELVSQVLDSRDPATWFIQLDKSVGKGANLPANYLRFSISGVARVNAPWYASGALYCWIEQRPDKGSGFGP